MKKIKEINPVLLVILMAIVFTTSFAFAQVAFDFSLSNGGDKSVVQGSAITNTITTTLTAGTPAPVSFSVSGLPPESTASISPSSCTPSSSGAKTCSPTPVINISTDTLTPAGVYPITITGTTNVSIPPPVTIFPNQSVTAVGICPNGPTGSSIFSGTININNQSSYTAYFQRKFGGFHPIGLELAPENFEVTANTIKAKTGFGAVSFTRCPATPPSPYGPTGGDIPTGSATYSVTINSVVSEVTYSWSYAI